MYSRKTGNIYNDEIQSKIDNFNKDVREQYRSKILTNDIKRTSNTAKNEGTPGESGIINALKNDELLIIGLILLLLSEEKKDYPIICILAALLFLNR